MNAKNVRRAVRRSLVALVSVALVLGQVSEPALAQVTLADIPIASKVQAKPNIVYTLDDSGSMQFPYLPDWVIAGGAAVPISSITRLGATATATVTAAAWGTLTSGQYITIYNAVPPEYNGTFQITRIASPKFTFTVTGTPANILAGSSYTVGPGYCRGGNNTTACTANSITYGNTFQSPPFYAAEFNALAYNPDVTYAPPVKADGTPLTHIVADTNMATGDAVYTNAQTFPFFGDGSLNTHVNLSGKVAVPVYCNTDWPITVGGPLSNLTINDLGDVNGEGLASGGVPNAVPKPGTGAWCRINGTPYELSVASGAPAVAADYNYPYQQSAGAKNVQYFFQSLGNKILYCDTSSPYYPRNPAVITACNGGAPVTGTAKQTCVASGVPGKTCNPTPALRNFTPAACKPVIGNPAYYCAPGVGGSDGFSTGTGGTPECVACTCNADFQPATPGPHCSIVTATACPVACGVGGCDIAHCPDQTTAITGCGVGTPIYGLSTAVCAGGNGTTLSQFLWDPYANAVSATTTLTDSNGNGYACRHNNQIYAVTGAGGGTPYTYPRTNANDVYAVNKAGPAPFLQTGAFTQAMNTAGYNCPTIGVTINIPRHYYQISSVQFCDTVDTTPNSQWRGYGIGACQATNDLGAHPIVKYGTFTRIGLVNDGRTFKYIDQLTGLPGTPDRTFAQESANYANWFAYYRLRAHAAKTTSSLAFNLLDDTYRVGFHTLGTEPAPYGVGAGAVSWVDVGDFKGTVPGTTRGDWWGGFAGGKGLFDVKTITTNKTPTLSAMVRIGNLFERGNNGGIPPDIAALPGATKDPLDVKDKTGKVISCQSNYHILFTDGFTNQLYQPVIAGGDQDDTTPGAWPAPGTLPDGSNNPDNVLPDLPNGAAWPQPFRWGTKKVSDTLADVGMNFWARDLRGAFMALQDDVPSWSGKTPNDIDPTKDVAWWQHVQFSAISFGASGTLDASSSQAQKDTLECMTIPTPVQCIVPPRFPTAWPDVSTPNNPPLPPGNKGAVAVDDLWHAAVNARGTFVFAKSPLEVQNGLGHILAGIANNRKSATGAGFNGQVLGAGNNTIYEPTIEPGWSGDLLKVKIDPATGNELATDWQANTVLANKILPAFAGDEPWLDETKRRIVSWDGTKPVAFRALVSGSMPSALTAAQLLTLSADPIMQYRMVSYLRGGTTVNPPYGPAAGYAVEGTDVGQFRQRTGRLGDISHAQPLVVSAPVNPPIFNIVGADPGYDTYVTTWNPDPLDATLARPDRIVAAANDGMVHVFDSADGNEIFAYVPNALFRKATDPAFPGPGGVDEAGKANGLQALLFQDGPPSIYKHHFYVDSSPRTADVDFNSCGVKGCSAAASDWHTIVVGGLGKGGGAYYALDLTLPDAADEKSAGLKLLWEATDPDWKYTYGRPIIVKTYAYGWVVIVTSGYNNKSGEGRIYFLDPRTGAQIGRKFMNTPKITCKGPDGVLTETTGMAQINGFTLDFHNQFVEQVYGGDLCGNVWRFDLSDPNDGNWTVVNFARLSTDGGGANGQPVTTAPQIEVDYKNGTDRYVFVGTGQLLDPTDLTTPTPAQMQTMYAIRDGSVTTVRPAAGLPLVARAVLKPIDPTGAAIVGGAPDGWFHDLPDGTGAQPSERVVVDPEADVSVVTYIGTQVTPDPCTIALPVNVYAREYGSGKTLIMWTDPKTGATYPYYHDDAGGVGIQVVGLTTTDAAGNITGMTLGAILSHEIPGAGPVSIQNPSAFGRNRFSWRLLSGE